MKVRQESHNHPQDYVTVVQGVADSYNHLSEHAFLFFCKKNLPKGKTGALLTGVLLRVKTEADPRVIRVMLIGGYKCSSQGMEG